MLNYEIKKKIQLKKGKTKPESNWLTDKTRDHGHKIMITP